MENIKLIIFDLDGTLVDAYPAIIKSFNYAMSHLKYPKQSASTIRRTVGHGDENLLKPFIKIKEIKKALLVYRRHHKTDLLEGSSLFPNVNKVLVYLKDKGYKLAIASNRPTRFSWILIRHLGLGRYFDYVLCADRLKHKKPHPEILLKIIQKSSVKPEQALYVGDMAIDAQAAKRAKVRAAMVTTGSSTRKELKQQKPSRIMKRITDLLKIV